MPRWAPLGYGEAVRRIHSEGGLTGESEAVVPDPAAFGSGRRRIGDRVARWVGLVGCWAVAFIFVGFALLLAAPILVPLLFVTALAFLVFRRGGFPRHIDII